MVWYLFCGLRRAYGQFPVFCGGLRRSVPVGTSGMAPSSPGYSSPC